MSRASEIIEKYRPHAGAIAPAVFLLLAAAPGGLRGAAAWAVFSAALFIYLAVFEKESPFSGLGIWALFGMWLLGGVVFSPEPLNSFWWFSRYLALFAFYSLARRSGEKARTVWIGAVFFLAGASCLTVFWQALTGQGVSRTFEVTGMIGPNVNYSAAFMAAAFAGLSALLLISRKNLVRASSICGLALLGAAIVAINSRGAVLGVLAAVYALIFIQRRFRWALYPVIAGLALAAFLPAEHFNWLMKLYDPRSLGRFAIWGSAFDAISARPFFGWGPGLYERAFEIFKFPFHDGISYYGHATLHSHSEAINIAAEAGVPAGLLFVCAWAAGVFRSAAGDAKSVILKVFAVSLFAQSAVDIIFYSGAPQVLFFGTLGMLASGGSRPAPQSGPRSRWPLLLLLLVCGCAAFALRYSFARDKACALDRSLSPEVRERCLGKASAFAPGDPALLAAAIPLSLAVHGNPALAAALAEEAMLNNPKDPFRCFEAASLYRSAGDDASAKKLLFRALALEPDFLRARLALAEVLEEGGNPRAASLENIKIEAVLKRKPDISRASPYSLQLLSLPPGTYGGTVNGKP